MALTYELTEDKKAQLRNVIGTALEDKSFKERLMKNPEAAVQELYPDFEAGRPVVVTDQTDDYNKQYLNISKASYVMVGGNPEELSIELSEEELEMVAGGEKSCGMWSCNKGNGGGPVIKI